jgi:hypothetical protein
MRREWLYKPSQPKVCLTNDEIMTLAGAAKIDPLMAALTSLSLLPLC